MREDRFAGVLLGVHAGDSLGATTEFAERARARQLLPSEVDAAEIVGGGIFDWTPGAATDDTDLTLALVHGYLDTDVGSSDEVIEAAARHMLRWKQGGPRDIGGATSKGLETFERTGDPFRSGSTDERSQGNGSLMRTAPVALARHDDPTLRAREAAGLSAITHAHVVCRDACVAYCDLLAYLIGPEARFGDLDDQLRSIVTGEGLDRRVRDAISTGRERSIDEVDGVNGASQGWVLTSLSLAIAALVDGRPAAQVLLDVVRLGGDADTNGAIVGGLLGARDGVGAWPDRWLGHLEHGDALREAARSFAAR